MKKLIVSLFVSAAMLASGSAMAQCCKKDEKAKTESCCKKGEKKDCCKKTAAVLLRAIRNYCSA